MHRSFTAFLSVASLAFAAAPAAAAAPAVKSTPCMGAKCPAISFAAEGCSLSNTGSDAVTVTIFPDDAWRAAHPSERFPVEITLQPGETRSTGGATACLHPERNVQHWTAFAGKPATVKKVSASDVLFGQAKATLCTGEACKEIELKVFDDGCLWLQSTSEKPVLAELTLESGAKIALALEAADAAKAKAKADAGSPTAKKNAQARAAECKQAIASAELLENLRKSGTNVPAGEIDTTASECRMEAAAAEAAKKTASAPLVGYHYSIYSPISEREYPVFRAKAMNKDACAAKTDLKAYTATFAKP